MPQEQTILSVSSLDFHYYYYFFSEIDTSDPVDDRLLEECLKQSSQKRNIYKIEGRQSRKLISDGDFYLSSTWQETVQAKNNQGDGWQKCLIVKTLPQGEQARSFVETNGWFKKEIMVRY